MTMEEVIAKVEQDSQPEKVLISIPEDKRKRIPDEICKILMGNWIVRIKNKNFWLAAIPALLLLVQTVAALFGFTLDLGEIGDKLLAVVNAVFALLVILGVVNDPTTAGIADSKQARTYSSPKED